MVVVNVNGKVLKELLNYTASLVELLGVDKRRKKTDVCYRLRVNPVQLCLVCC